MSVKPSLVSQVSNLLGAPRSPEEGLALLELILQKSENVESFVKLKLPADTKLPECELSTAQELMEIMEATKQQVASFLSTVETEKEALRAHLGGYKQQYDAANINNQKIQRELNTAEAAYVEVQEIMITDRDTIADLNRRIKAASTSADAEEQILS